MKIGDTQVGKPEVIYKDTQTNLEALSSPVEGMVAYNTTLQCLGIYLGSAWVWDRRLLTLVWHVDGALAAPLTSVQGAFVMPSAGKLDFNVVYIKTSGTASTTILDININGTSIYDSANRPKVSYTTHTLDVGSGLIGTNTFAAGDVITFDIDGIATGAASVTFVLGYHLN